MKKEIETPALIQKRKLLLLVPVYVVAMFALAFYALGGGTGIASSGHAVVGGVNTSLPIPQAPSKGAAPDKLDMYASAARDSERLAQQRKQDPYGTAAANVPGRNDSLSSRAGANPQGLQMGVQAQQLATDKTVESALQKIQQMRQLIHPSAGDLHPNEYGPPEPVRGAIASEGIASAVIPPAGIAHRDPEMTRIDAMLDKLIRIQHPDGSPGDTMTPAPMHHLATVEKDESVRVLGLTGYALDPETGFMDIGQGDTPEVRQPAVEPAIRAAIDGQQTLNAGSTVALRMEQETIIDGLRIPAGQPVYGLASLTGERLTIHIASLCVGSTIINVSLAVYDLDGLPGIRVPGALTRDVSKESAGEALSGLGIASLDPSLSAQAAGAGLQMAKSLASRKLRLVRATLPSGYRVLLRNSK